MRNKVGIIGAIGMMLAVNEENKPDFGRSLVQSKPYDKPKIPAYDHEYEKRVQETQSIIVANEKAYAEQKQKQIMRNKGMQLFNINGIEIWALNLKNAERKAKKL